MRFQNEKDILPLYSDLYTALKSKGFKFPQYQQAPPKSNRVDAKTVKMDVPEQYKKLLEDMNLVKGNINLTNQMIDTSKPKDLQEADNPINDLISTLKEMEPKMMEMITTIENDKMMNVCLIVNDDLQKTFSRYEKLKKGKQPEPFIPGESK